MRDDIHVFLFFYMYPSVRPSCVLVRLRHLFQLLWNWQRAVQRSLGWEMGEGNGEDGDGDSCSKRFGSRSSSKRWVKAAVAVVAAVAAAAVVTMGGKKFRR